MVVVCPVVSNDFVLVIQCCRVGQDFCRLHMSTLSCTTRLYHFLVYIYLCLSIARPCETCKMRLCHFQTHTEHPVSLVCRHHILDEFDGPLQAS